MCKQPEHGVRLTKEYARNGFLPTDLQWQVTGISDDFTLHDLFVLVKYAESMIPNISATFGMCNFNAFWDQINLLRKYDDSDKDELEYLELYWCPEYDVRTTIKTNNPTDQKKISGLEKWPDNFWDDPMSGELPNLMAFHGIGSGCPSSTFDDHVCNADCSKQTAYGIEFSPINNLAHLPIRVSPNLLFHPPFVESDRCFNNTKFSLTIQPTLWCLITSIMWELTFCGSTPDEIEEKGNQLNDEISQAMEQLEEENDGDSDGN